MGGGAGLQPLPQGSAGGAPAWGPLWEPPQYRGCGSSRFKVELIQRGQPSHLETQKEKEPLWGRRGQLRRTGLQAPLPQALGPPRGAPPGTGLPPNPHCVGRQPSEPPRLWLWLCRLQFSSLPGTQRGQEACPRSHSFLGGVQPQTSHSHSLPLGRQRKGDRTHDHCLSPRGCRATPTPRHHQPSLGCSSASAPPHPTPGLGASPALAGAEPNLCDSAPFSELGQDKQVGGASSTLGGWLSPRMPGGEGIGRQDGGAPRRAA